MVGMKAMEARENGGRCVMVKKCDVVGNLQDARFSHVVSKRIGRLGRLLTAS
jgi:hypothetical protein